MTIANYIVAQNINPFAGLGELGIELNDLRSFVVVVILVFGIGMLYLVIDRSRQKTRRQEIESQIKIAATHAQEGNITTTTIREMFAEFAKVTQKQSETMQVVGLAIERSSNVGMANAQAITANTEATFTVNETMKTLPAAVTTIIEGAAQRNLASYTAQMTTLGTDLQAIQTGIRDINKALRDKHWLNSTDAAKIFASQERIDKVLNTLILNTMGEFPTVTDTVIQSDEKKEGET